MFDGHSALGLAHKVLRKPFRVVSHYRLSDRVRTPLSPPIVEA